MKTVAILGASPKPGRFAYQALLKLKSAGYMIFPVHPKVEQIEDVEVISALSAITTEIDTLTLYVGPARLAEMVTDVLKLNPRRIIFNPGTESDEIQQQFEDSGIECVRDCTLVMLDQNRF